MKPGEKIEIKGKTYIAECDQYIDCTNCCAIGDAELCAVLPPCEKKCNSDEVAIIFKEVKS